MDARSGYTFENSELGHVSLEVVYHGKDTVLRLPDGRTITIRAPPVDRPR